MKSLLFAPLGLALGACVPATPTYLVAPADPAIPGRGPRYATVTAGVRNYAVVEPRDWLEQNRRVTPGANRERGDSDDAARRGR